MRREKLLKSIELERLLDLKIDFAFKQLFGSEQNKSITIVFLNAILQKTKRGMINNIHFQNIEIILEHKVDKEARLDILAETDRGETINIEIQFSNKYDMVKRSLYYWAEVYSFPFEKSMVYQTLKPVIAINIMNFTIFKETNRFHTTFHLYEQSEKFQLTDAMELHFIEMPKLIHDWQQNQLDPWDDVLARWLLLLGMVDQRKSKVYEDIFKELEAIAMEDKSLRRAFEKWEVLSGTKEEVAAYRARMKRLLDEESMIGEAELRGEEKGLEKAAKQTALKMWQMGMELDVICKVTGLAEEKITKIIEEHHEKGVL